MDYGPIYVTWDLQMSQWTPKLESMQKTEWESAFFEKKNRVWNGWQMLVNKKLAMVNDGKQQSTTKRDGQPKSIVKYTSQCQLQAWKVNNDVVVD